MKRTKKAEPGFTYVRVERNAYKRFVEFCKVRGYHISPHATDALDYYRLSMESCVPDSIEQVLRGGKTPK